MDAPSGEISVAFQIFDFLRLIENLEVYHGQYSEERLVRALSGVHPMELYRVSRDNPAKLPGWRRYVYPIYTTYNGKCRKDALPMKF